LVEDLAMGIDLSIMGFSAYLCQEVRVTSELPEAGKAAEGQRTRWEHGHLATIQRYVPRLLKGAASRGRPALLAQALDLGVPPLALLVVTLVGCAVVSGLFFVVSGALVPVSLATASLSLVGLAVVLSWARHARDVISARTLLSIPFYVLWKIPLYFSFLKGEKQKSWVRTERTVRDPDSPEP
jgi:cellulose synthase/poly-beta-1,6-N-acetylglucosamine synthase-like glycosyltransferase